MIPSPSPECANGVLNLSPNQDNGANCKRPSPNHSNISNIRIIPFLKLFNYVLSERTQHGVPADRFAREIVPFLKSFCAARSRQLNTNPLGGFQ
jgi:hypothetical protein